MNNKIDLRCKRTKKLLSHSLFMLLTQYSMEDITIGKICENAMVHRTTFYKHFSDKYDLFEYLIKINEEEIFSDIGNLKDYKLPLDYFMHIIQLALIYVKENRNELNKILQINKDDMVSILLYGTLERELILILQAQKIDFNIPLKIIAKFYIGGFVSLVIYWITTPNNYSINDILKYMKEFISSKNNLIS